MGDTRYECTHDKAHSRWIEVEAYDPEEAAASYCEQKIKADWHSAPLVEDGADCTVYVRPADDPTDETEWNVRCVFETPSFYAEEV